ncbi:MAG: NAD(P)H-dependent flavin oxidoreductase [Bacteroidia bacterium]
MQAELCTLLGIQHPIIMAPMFLVTTTEMMIAANRAGITGCIPAHNFRSDAEFRKSLQTIRENAPGPIGVNVVSNRSNLYYKSQLKACLDLRVDYIITSLGSPEEIIRECRPLGIKVICDVINEEYAMRVAAMKPDALIAVNNLAGGHFGPLPPETLIPLLKQKTGLPIISAGGVGNHQQMEYMLSLGACGVSIGSPFIATTEASVSDAYKQAIVDYGEKDIVMTTKISGTPCAVINTPYLQKIGTQQNWLEALLNKNKRLKKWAKMLTFYKGMRSLEKAAFSATYQTIWCAGKSIESVHSVRSIEEVVRELIKSV